MHLKLISQLSCPLKTIDLFVRALLNRKRLMRQDKIYKTPKICIYIVSIYKISTYNLQLVNPKPI